MQFDLFTKGLAQLHVDCLVVGIHEDGELADSARIIDRASDGALARLLARGDFAGRAGESLLLPGLPQLKATRVLLVGQGHAARASRAARGAGRSPSPWPPSLAPRCAAPPSP